MANEKRYAGVIVKYQDKVLLCKRNKEGSFPGMWSIPAGHLEDNETSMECAKREFFEETDIDIDNETIKFVGLIPRYTKDGEKVKGLMYVYLYEPNEPVYPDLENAMDGKEHTECGYFTYNQIEVGKTGTHLHKLLGIILEKV